MGTLAVEVRGNEAWAGEGDAGECDVAAPGELAGNEAWAGECDVAAPGELAGNEAGAGATVVVSSAWGGSVEPPGPPQAAGASFEERGAGVAERFMSLT